jgi:predicted permease
VDGTIIGIVSGALVGVLLISTTDLPLAATDVVASLVYVVAIPFCAIALVLERYSLSGPSEAH